MKNRKLWAVLFLTGYTAFANTDVKSLKTNVMEQQAIETVKTVFKSADDRNWSKIEDVMANEVYLDYESLSGNPASELYSTDIINSWKNFLPGFDRTEHNLSNFEVSLEDNQAKVKFDGTANHFIGSEIWTVSGDYEALVIKSEEKLKVTKLKFSLKNISGNTSLPAKATENANKNSIGKKEVRFQSEGLTLVGHLYTPRNFNENKTYPAVVVDGSWTTVKEQMQGLYARRLAEEGFITLAFDHRYYGESEGQPRQYENHEAKVQDIKDAVTYLQTLSFVDNENIAGLGICASGAYMMEATAEDDRIKALATVVAWLMTPETAKFFYGGDEGTTARIEKGKKAKELFAETGEAKYVPAYEPDNMEAAMFFPVDYYAKPDRGAIPAWDNNFAVMSWEKWLTYDGIASSKNVDVPVIMIASEKQFLPDGSKTALKNLTNDNVEAKWYNDYEHIDFYDNSKAIDEAVKAISERFTEVLK